MTSQLKTVFFLGLLTGLLMLLGGFLGGRAGLFIAFGLAMVMNLGSYWYSDKLVLRMYQARELSPGDAPHIHRVVEEMAARAGIPKPRIVLIPQDAPNAFATGRNPENAVVAVTRGIVSILDPEELRGVLGHELGHIVNRDILIQTVAAVLAGAIVFIANLLQWSAIFGIGGSRDDEGGGNPLAALAMAFLAPVAATMIQMAISRSREYLADATGARLAGSPLPLAGALGKLEAAAHQIPMQGSPATENLFIVSPFRGRGAASLFSTHPPVEERIARLRAMSQTNR